jgi:hypothetical protein
VSVAKSEHGLSAHAAEELMSSYAKPNWLAETVTEELLGGYTLAVDTLAWGATRMLRDLFADDAQSFAAEATAKKLPGRR